MTKPEFKFQVIQKRLFLEGSLKGMTIEHKSLCYENYEDAVCYAKTSEGLTVAGGLLGPKCVIKSAQVVML